MWHKGLLVKLKAIGIRGLLLEWFCDYLTNCMQTVVIKGEKSRLKRVVSGVPQVSVLGPLLFLIYINDIVNDIQTVIKLFADDTSMSLAVRTPNVRADIINSDLQKVIHWAKKWKVKFHEEKIKLLNCIRDMPESRGLGDVYKRQGPSTEPWGTPDTTLLRRDFSPFITIVCMRFVK